jgi:hypothetical protein
LPGTFEYALCFIVEKKLTAFLILNAIIQFKEPWLQSNQI